MPNPTTLNASSRFYQLVTGFLFVGRAWSFANGVLAQSTDRRMIGLTKASPGDWRSTARIIPTLSRRLVHWSIFGEIASENCGEYARCAERTKYNPDLRFTEEPLAPRAAPAPAQEE
jgi:hypothetical protein